MVTKIRKYSYGTTYGFLEWVIVQPSRNIPLFSEKDLSKALSNLTLLCHRSLRASTLKRHCWRSLLFGFTLWRSFTSNMGLECYKWNLLLYEDTERFYTFLCKWRLKMEHANYDVIISKLKIPWNSILVRDWAKLLLGIFRDPNN